MIRDTDGSDWGWGKFSLLIFCQLWLAHALAMGVHEFCHSFSAWLLGWKSNPWALHYPPPSLVFFLVQLGVTQDVNETPIFASGHGVDAAIIAIAGALVGNALITYPLSRWLYAKAKQAGAKAWAMLGYWLTVASVGNFFDYIPIRTFTTESDYGSVERGFGWSPWTVIVLLGIPTLAAMVYLFARIEPLTLRWLFPASRAKRSVIAVVTAAVMFCFYGAAGFVEGGPISYKLSVLSVTILFPVMAVITGLAARHNEV
jgi:hypothetical protein